MPAASETDACSPPASTFIPTLLSSLLAGACCPLQLLLSWLSLPCAGFALLVPFRSALLSIAAVVLIRSILVSRNNYMLRAGMIAGSAVLAFSPEMVEWSNRRGGSLSLPTYSLFGSTPTSLLSYMQVTGYDAVYSDADSPHRQVLLFSVSGLKCEACAANLRSRLAKAVADIDLVAVDFHAKEMRVHIKGYVENIMLVVDKIKWAVVGIDGTVDITLTGAEANSS